MTIHSTVDRRIQHFAALPVNPKRSCQFIAVEKSYYQDSDKCGEAPVVGKPFCRAHCAVVYELPDQASAAVLATLLRLSRVTGRSYFDHLLALMDGEMRHTSGALPSGEVPRKNAAL